VELDAFIVMPNHVHGIIIIDKLNDAQTPNLDHTIVHTPNLGVSTNGGKNPNWKPATLGVIINQYKRICTINARKIHVDFEWQSNYHDRIIRNDDSFYRIQQYIINNPNKWDQDKFCQLIDDN
jgi:REP element-mobilizing transposase RayT